ncbi:putative Histone-lysine N-methyltransferase SUV39H2 [Hypsibius exemplaris]|uniref:Histone-lysine N-methyltransferase SUV39H2 n=1 Tax=Hypsibius exemplaris TaxID=2072580 RepID=A0A1W0WM86_HYPEX|nr:putative Histone-lysine N-methyltransferase SUV39H2 [Hypsibius exemplaris]
MSDSTWRGWTPQDEPVDERAAWGFVDADEEEEQEEEQPDDPRDIEMLDTNQQPGYQITPADPNAWPTTRKTEAIPSAPNQLQGLHHFASSFSAPVLSAEASLSGGQTNQLQGLHRFVSSFSAPISSAEASLSGGQMPGDHPVSPLQIKQESWGDYNRTIELKQSKETQPGGWESFSSPGAGEWESLSSPGAGGCGRDGQWASGSSAVKQEFRDVTPHQFQQHPPFRSRGRQSGPPRNFSPEGNRPRFVANFSSAGPSHRNHQQEMNWRDRNFRPQFALVPEPYFPDDDGTGRSAGPEPFFPDDDGTGRSAGRRAAVNEALAHPPTFENLQARIDATVNPLSVRDSFLWGPVPELVRQQFQRTWRMPDEDPVAKWRRLNRQANESKPRKHVPSYKQARKCVRRQEPLRSVPPPLLDDSGADVHQLNELQRNEPESDRVPLGQAAAAGQSSRGPPTKATINRINQDDSTAICFIPLGRKEPTVAKDARPAAAESPTPSSDSESDEDLMAPVKPIAEKDPNFLNTTVIIQGSQLSPEKLAGRLERLNIDRDCMYPYVDIPDAQAWRSAEGEVGFIPQHCLCAADAVSLKDPLIQQMMRQADVDTLARLNKRRCCATYRDRKCLLSECDTVLDLSERTDRIAKWLPQRGVVGFFCGAHTALLEQHKVCPYCNEFYKEGNIDFTVCRKRKAETHLYHLDCQVRMSMARECPHCLHNQSTSIQEWYDSNVTVKSPVGGGGNLMSERDLQENFEFPNGKGGMFSYSGYLSKSDMTELRLLQEPENLPKETLEAGVSTLEPRVLHASKASSPRLLQVLQANGDTLLHIAARQGNVVAILILQECGLSNNAKNAAGETPLIVAVKNRQISVMQCLVALDVDINQQDKEGCTALHWAARLKWHDGMVFLRRYRADPAMTDKHGFAAVFHTLTWIKQHEFYALARARIGLMHMDREGWSLMHWAAALHRNDLLIYLVDLGLASAGDTWGDTPMHVAVRVGNVKFVKTLLGDIRPPLRVIAVNKTYQSPYELAAAMARTSENHVLRQNARKIVKLMERLMTPADLKLSPEGRAPIRGEICGDISRGRNIVPIPCYNFVGGEAYGHELIYSDVVVRPRNVYQRNPRINAETQELLRKEPCLLSAGSSDCLEGKCSCAKVELCPVTETRTFCSHDCRSKKGVHHISPVIDDCYVPAARGSGPIVMPFPGKSKPPTIDVLRLRSRLVQQAARRPALAHDLQHVVDLVDSEFRRPRRTRSVGRQRSPPSTLTSDAGRHLPINYPFSGQWKPDFQQLKRKLRKRNFAPRFTQQLLDMVDAADAAALKTKVISSRRTQRSRSVVAVPKSDGFSSSYQTDSSSSTARSERNPLDLFDEIERYQFSFLTQAAVVRFERRHLFERWDMSFYNGEAPRRHPRDPGTDVQLRKTDFPDETPIATDDYISLASCSVLCECGPQCPKRIWQRPSTARMALVYILNVGWGVIALTKISRGQFLTEYTGEFVHGNLYDNDTYLYELNIRGLDQQQPMKRKKGVDPQEGRNEWVVDAAKVGNIGRYFNHCCVANAKTVEIHEHGIAIPRLCVFALRTIYPGQFITLDYGDGWWNAKMESDIKVCLCRHPDCRFKEPLRAGRRPSSSGDEEDHSDQDDADYR